MKGYIGAWCATFYIYRVEILMAVTIAIWVIVAILMLEGWRG